MPVRGCQTTDVAEHPINDKFYSQVTQNINLPKYKDYKVDNGLLYWKTKIKDHLFDTLVILSKLQHNVLHATHENLGHMGISKTYAFLWQRYFWPGMKNKLQITSKHVNSAYKRS